jgi:uncharacterized protein (UPF0332 family)
MVAFDACLRNGRLKRVEPDPVKLDQEIRTAISELRHARGSYADGDNEECAVEAYFAMSRTLRVLLVRLGYRDTSAHGLIAGLDRLYVQPGRMGHHLLEILKLAKNQKDHVQDGARCGRTEARLILSGAEGAMEVARGELALGWIPELDSMNLGDDADLEES